MCYRWSLQEKGLTVTVTLRPATCWTSCCRSRRTLTQAQDLPPQAPWAQDRAQVQVLDRAQDQDQAVERRRVELLAAEQVSTVLLNMHDVCYIFTGWNKNVTFVLYVLLNQGAATPVNTLAVLTLWNMIPRPRPNLRHEAKSALKAASHSPRCHRKERGSISSNTSSRSLSGF